MGYKLEWTAPNGQVLSMIYTSDTRPDLRSAHGRLMRWVQAGGHLLSRDPLARAQKR